MHMLRKAQELYEYTLRAQNGLVGKVGDLYFDDDTWTIRYLVAEADSRIPGRQVLISPIAVKSIDDMKKSILLNLTVEQVRGSPPADTEQPISREYETEYFRYYGWPAYWQGGDRWGWGTYPMDMRLPGADSTQHPVAGNPHLRSAQEWRGYAVDAPDGRAGAIDDIIINDETWALRYVIVNTGQYLPVGEVLLSPLWIDAVNWERSCIAVEVTCASIAAAPEYDPRSVVTRNFELRVFRHFGREEDFDAVRARKTAAKQ